MQDDLSDDQSIEPLDSDDEEEDLVAFYEKQKRGHSADELVVTAAKQTGKELYADMRPHERKDKLDSQVWFVLSSHVTPLGFNDVPGVVCALESLDSSCGSWNVIENVD